MPFDGFEHERGQGQRHLVVDGRRIGGAEHGDRAQFGIGFAGQHLAGQLHAMSLREQRIENGLEVHVGNPSLMATRLSRSSRGTLSGFCTPSAAHTCKPSR